MGGRGMMSQGSLTANTHEKFSFSATPEDVTFTHIFTDKKYRGYDEIRGSEGKIISRAYLQQIVQKRPLANGRQKELINDIDHADFVKIQSGKYVDTFKIVDDATKTLVAPKEMQNFFKVSWKSGVALQASLSMSYVVLDKETPRAGTIPFLQQSEWRILSRNAQQGIDRYSSPNDTFDQEKPTLTWVSGGKIRELFIKGKDTTQFLEETGLNLTSPKGPFVAAKRISRVFRPYKYQQQFHAQQMQLTFRDGRFILLNQDRLTRETLSKIDGSDVSRFEATLADGQKIKIQYMDQSPAEAKVWDGAGVVSREMLKRTLIRPEMTTAEKERVRREIQKMGRVEYTLLTPSGQDKGHAIVSDDLSTEFLLPQDSKTEVQLVNGDIFVGFSPVKAKDQLLLDEQTMINHRQFLQPDMLISRLEEKGLVYEQGVLNGRISQLMQEIDPEESIDNLQRWPFREFMASGGNPLWSSSHTKTVYNQHLNKIAEMGEHGLSKVKLPVPGGRYYVMPASVGQRAGIQNLAVGRGEIQLDKARATAWVNEEDWLKLQDGSGGEAGIANILGGADNDDSLLVIPFTDKADGEKKVLALRNPNEAGEYIILKPTTSSRTITWRGAIEEVEAYPELDSRNLTPRIDNREKTYLNLIDPESGPQAETEVYSVEAMETAVERAMDNAGIFQRYANFLMVAEAIGYQTTLPDGLETLVDGMNKTGIDLRPIDSWLKHEAEKMIEAGIQVPAHMQPRTPTTIKGKRPLQTHNHWVDQRQQKIQNHVDTMSTRRDDLASTSRMPAQLFDSVFEHPNTVYMGAGYLQQYSSHLNQLMRQRPNGLRAEDYDILRQEAEQYLNQYPKQLHTTILRGAMVSLQMQDEVKSDAALWLRGETLPDGRFKPGIGNKMNQALREIGLLGEPITTTSGTIIYHNPEQQLSKIKTVGIRDVWFNHYRWEQGKANQPIPETKTAVPKNHRSIAKRKIATASQTTFKQMTLFVKEKNGRLATYTHNGNLFGILDGKEHELQVGDTITIQHAYAIDGNLRVILSPEKNPA